MPITCRFELVAVDEQEFHAIDYRVMGVVFAVHRQLGPLFCNEKIYQRELAHQCVRAGFRSVESEVPVTVSFREFQKTYFIDLVVDGVAVYELKAVRALHAAHRKQALHYLLLLGLRHAKLVNMRPTSVEYEFVSTQISPQRRRELSVDDTNWSEIGSDCRWLNETMHDLLADWGAFLEVELYYEALTFFLGGEENVVRGIPIMSESRELGVQRAHLLQPHVAFKITAVTNDIPSYERHLRRFLSLTNLRAIHWINMNHHNVLMKTIFASGDTRQA